MSRCPSWCAICTPRAASCNGSSTRTLSVSPDWCWWREAWPTGSDVSARLWSASAPLPAARAVRAGLHAAAGRGPRPAGRGGGRRARAHVRRSRPCGWDQAHRGRRTADHRCRAGADIRRIGHVHLRADRSWHGHAGHRCRTGHPGSHRIGNGLAAARRYRRGIGQATRWCRARGRCVCWHDRANTGRGCRAGTG
jgi:hypothetical protein